MSIATSLAETPLSIGALAKLAGVDRARFYAMYHAGKLRAEKMSGGLIVMPDEVQRVLRSATKVKTASGKTRVVFEEAI